MGGAAMQKKVDSVQSQRTIAAIISFLLIFILLMVIAVMNAPTMVGFKVLASVKTYLTEVRRTALPFLGVVGIGALALGFVVARMVYSVWPNKKNRMTMLAAYGFLAPYLIVTLVFTVGVILFALYISFNNYDIFTPPQRV